MRRQIYHARLERRTQEIAVPSPVIGLSELNWGGPKPPSRTTFSSSRGDGSIDDFI